MYRECYTLVLCPKHYGSYKKKDRSDFPKSGLQNELVSENVVSLFLFPILSSDVDEIKRWPKVGDPLLKSSKDLRSSYQVQCPVEVLSARLVGQGLTREQWGRNGQLVTEFYDFFHCDVFYTLPIVSPI